MSGFYCKINWILSVALCTVLALAGTLWKVVPAQAIELGKTYDKSNYQEIEELLIPPVLNWLKKGEIVMKTSPINFDYGEQCKAYDEYSQKTSANLFLMKTGY